MIGILPDDEVGDEIEAGEAADQWCCRCGGENGRLIQIVFEANFDALDDLTNATSGLVVEEFGDFVADDFVSLGVGFVFGWEVGLFFGFKTVEPFDSTAVLSLGLFSFCVVGFLLRGGCFVVGRGFVLF